MTFEWETEDAGWDQRASLPDPEPPGKRPFPFWLLLLLLVVIGGILLLWQQLANRVSQVELSASDDVAASHQLIRQSTAAGDLDLFTTFLSGREPWSTNVTAAFLDGTLFDRRAMGLAWQPGAGITPTITLSPTLAMATAVFTETYAIDLGNGLTDTVQLQHTAVYRLGPNRWLYAPSDPPETAVRDVIESAHLFLSFPQTETAVAQRLALDLDTTLAAVCNLPGLTCPADYQQLVELETDPAALAWLDVPTLLQRGEPRIVLPGPSLIGEPVDEASYQAMARGYGRLIAAVTIAELTGYECCKNGAFFSALLTAYYQQLGLQGPPLSPAAWAQLAADLPTLEMIGFVLQNNSDWSALDADLAILHSLIAFLVREVGLPVADVQRLILADENQLPPPLNDLEILQRRWWRFLQENASPTAVSPSVPPLTLLCLPDDGGDLTEMAYNPATAEFTPITRYPYRDGLLLSLPTGGEAVVLRDPGGRTFLRQNASETTILEIGLAPELAPEPVMVGGNGRYLLLHTPGISSLPYTLVDLEACASGACFPDSLFGYPVWSPDGTRSVVVSTNLPPQSALTASGVLSLNNAAAKDPATIGGGLSPFWLDDDTVGYISSNNAAEVVMLDLITYETTSLTLADLNVRLPEPLTAVTTRFLWAAADPAQPDTLLLLVQAGASQPTLRLLRVALTDTAVTTLLSEPIDNQPVHFINLSPDGRWLIITRPVTSGGTLLSIINLASGEVLPRLLATAELPRPIWSPDSRWFVLIRDGIVQVVPPETAVTHTIIAPTARCVSAIWRAAP